MDRAVGLVTYTQLCNERGGIECDLTATRLDGGRYFVVTGTAFGAHDLGWLQQQRDALADTVDDVTGVELVDVTSTYTCYGLWGPAARAILQPLTRSPLGNEAFPYLTAQRISIGSIPVIALRVTYVGELGWELYCPAEYGATLWDLLWDAGSAHGMLAGGYRAIDALRVEKGYRVWSSDITPDDTPLEAGLGFAVCLDKPVSFTGQAALRRQKVEGVTRRLRCLALADPRAVVVGSEPVRVGGEVSGRVTSGGYGFRSARSLAFAYLPVDAAQPGRSLSVELFGEWIQAEVVRDPVWDPSGDRIRA
jgi:4-methylaminobutanoate oxidase (formaldehyde-forming)